MKKSLLFTTLNLGLLVIAMFLLSPAVKAGEGHDHNFDHSHFTSYFAGEKFKCAECGKSSELETCSNCKGTGKNGGKTCGNCKGSGQLHKDCDHAYVPEKPAPELVFTNPVLKSGTANKEGAIYRFGGVMSGIDAEVKLKKFSRTDIVMKSIDKADMGWGKAFQPEFGLPGLVLPYQTWYIDFEVTFYEAGTNSKKKVSKFDITSLDVDGDGNSISEFISLEKPSAITYSTISYLTGVASIIDGVDMDDVQGPIDNFSNIDTTSTQVMTTYTYRDKDGFKFRMGAKSASKASNGSGIRLNSMWFRSFNLSSGIVLPVKLIDFTASVDEKGASLTWITAEEKNFSNFVVERSSDGKTYTEVAVIMAKEGNGQNSYTYTDKSVAANEGMLYYRIRLVDETREATFSNVRTVKLLKGDAQKIALSTFPNPVADQLRVSLPLKWHGKAVSLEIYNSNGVKVQAAQFSNAGQTELVPVQRLVKGFYIVKAVSGREAAQQSILKN